MEASGGGAAAHGARPRDVVILGSTGSIGTQALDVIRRNPARFRVVGLAAGGGNPALLAQQAIEFGVPSVAVARPSALADVRAALTAEAARASRPAAAASSLPEVLAGPDAVPTAAAWPCDVVLNGVTGAVGLAATIAALDAGRTLALANKESLITGGPLVTQRAAPGQIVPVDSEHSTIAQCLRGGAPEEVRRLVLTASGGPFRGWSRDRLATVTPEQALAHPTWNMGPSNTLNSATLVNKGLELIEAHLLFGVGLDRIAVVVHPQSIVHSMVEYTDGATIAMASPPDMRLPIALAMAWPEPGPGRGARAGLVEGGHLDLRAARRGGVPRRAAGSCGGRRRWHRAGRLQRRERGMPGRLHGRKDPFHRDRRHGVTGNLGAGRVPGRCCHPGRRARGRPMGAIAGARAEQRQLNNEGETA